MEKWVKPEFFKGFYAVSSLGRIKRIKRGRATWVGRIMKPCLSKNGYFMHSFSVGKNNQIYSSLHRIIYRAFKGEIPEGIEIDHIDGNTANNSINNLKTVTKSENNLRKNRIFGSQSGDRCHLTKIPDKEIPKIREMFNNGIGKHTIAKTYNVHWCTINGIVKYKTRHFLHLKQPSAHS